ncbi:MAG: hypothetical protein ACO1OT_18930 [Heyndrickxia sp.]
MMAKIYLAGEAYMINEDEYKKLLTLLPYWGLKVTDSGEIFGQSLSVEIAAAGISRDIQLKLEELLSHTNIKIKLSQSPIFSVSFNEHQAEPIILRIHSVTYRYNPCIQAQSAMVQDLIYKKLWLPKRVQPIDVSVHPEHRSKLPEWLSYLFIQYANRSEEFKSLADFTQEEYQRLATDYLMPLNPAFAATQLIDDFISDSWPVFPIDAPQFKNNLIPETGTKQPVKAHPAEESVEEDNPSLLEEEEIQDERTAPFSPFRNNHSDEATHPINPFKNEPSAQSIINPFKKGNR